MVKFIQGDIEPNGDIGPQGETGDACPIARCNKSSIYIFKW